MNNMRKNILSNTSVIAFSISFVVTIVVVSLVFFAKDIVMNLIPKPKATVETAQVSYIDTFIVINSVVQNKQDYILVDTRDEKSYLKAHIKNSINIPSSSILRKKYNRSSLEDKPGSVIVVVLSYSMFSTDGELVQKEFAKQGFKSFVLKAGWNEIFNLPNMWVPEVRQKAFSNQNSYINFAD